MMSKPILATFACALALLAGCATPFVPPPIPTTMVETIPNPPVTATPIIWQPGHWDWNGTGYVWTTGAYVPRDGHGTLYQPGYWTQTAAGWQWTPSHWP